MSALLVLLLAVALDLFLGEPPARVHPVVLMGRLISVLRDRARPKKLDGLAIALVLILASAGIGHLLIVAGNRLEIYGVPLGLLVAVYLLKSTFAIRCLLNTSAKIGCMIRDDMNEARKNLMAMVSRETANLSPSQATSAVIESLFENFVDSVLSPIFYFLLFTPFGLGVEAALAFKAISTMDSMLGYRTEALKEMGFVAARLDDLANWLPARLSLLPMIMSSPMRADEIFNAVRLYHASTPSPNSGWPMAAGAGALGLRLEKPGVYSINDGGRDPDPSDIPRALGTMGGVILVTLVLFSMALLAGGW